MLPQEKLLLLVVSETCYDSILYLGGGGGSQSSPLPLNPVKYLSSSPSMLILYHSWPNVKHLKDTFLKAMADVVPDLFCTGLFFTRSFFFMKQQVHTQPVITTASSTTDKPNSCLLYTSPSPRDATLSRMPSSA